ncbi:hypothetical protein B0T18DRAFT_431720 [Schizothecium vesticola]|uniref:Uncharacterized protein n=1 Tax=Schizothecium vesticola TaxID=314040 RepID=A0AA40EJB1_9PEZI|nr:hypothetical protein B0T18DRAFT_431720 [Schizothecium vesticola]
MASTYLPEVIDLTVKPVGTTTPIKASRWSRSSFKQVKTVCVCILSIVAICYIFFLFGGLNMMIFNNFLDCGFMVCPRALPQASCTATTLNNADNFIMTTAPAPTPASINNAAAVMPRGLATDRRPFTLSVDDTPPKGQSHITARAVEAHKDQHNLHDDTVPDPAAVLDPGLDCCRQKNLEPRTPADSHDKANVVALPGSGIRTDDIPPQFRKPPFAPANNNTHTAPAYNHTSPVISAHNTTDPPALAPNSTHPTPTHNTTLINHPPTAHNNTHPAPTNEDTRPASNTTLTYPALPPKTPFRRIFPSAPAPDSGPDSSQPPTFLLPPLSPGGPPRHVNQAGEPLPIPLSVFMMWRKQSHFAGLFNEVVPEGKTAEGSTEGGLRLSGGGEGGLGIGGDEGGMRRGMEEGLEKGE